MKQHYLLTVILMLLAFSAGWFWHDQPLEVLPAQPSFIEHDKKVFTAIESSPVNQKDPVSPEKTLPLESPESVLQTLLASNQYQRAVDFYREKIREVDVPTGLHLYQLIQAHLKEQMKQENFTNVLDLCRIFLDINPHDYSVTLVNVKAHLALGERQQAIELLYAIVSYVQDETEQKKIFDTIHKLASEEYTAHSSQQQWKELDSFYEYLLTQESSYWPYYLNDGIVLMNLQQYARAESKLNLLVDRDGLKDQARQLLARIQLLQAGGAVLPLQQHGNNYVSAVTFNGLTEANLMLDTGASVSVLDPDVFQKIPERDYELIQNSLTLQTANGPVVASVYRIHEFKLGNYRLENVDFAVLPVGNKHTEFNGLLGMNILNRFHFEIDQKNKELLLQPHF